MGRRFTTHFVVVTGLLAAAVLLAGQAATDGGMILSALAALAGIAGLLGFVVLARVVVLSERGSRRR